MNQNEFVQDGKRYVAKIRKCVCKKGDGKFYELNCHIIERGWNRYTYTLGSDFLQKWGDKKGFYLTKEAKDTLTEEISRFEEKVASMVVDLDDEEKTNDVVVFYHRVSSKQCDYLVRWNRADAPCRYYLFEAESLDNMLHELNYPFNDFPEETGKDITLEDNKIYQAAKRYGDNQMILEMKIYFHVATKEDCIAYGRLLGKRVLPGLTEDFNQLYTVDASTIDHDLLMRSGYHFFHCPYFSMTGGTRSKHRLNPHTKYAEDSGPVNGPCITFDDYLLLFDEVQGKTMREKYNTALLNRGDPVQEGEVYQGFTASKATINTKLCVENEVQVVNFDEEHTLLKVVGTNQFILLSGAVSHLGKRLFADKIDDMVDFGDDFNDQSFQNELNRYQVTENSGMFGAMVKRMKQREIEKMKQLFERSENQ